MKARTYAKIVQDSFKAGIDYALFELDMLEAIEVSCSAKDCVPCHFKKDVFNKIRKVIKNGYKMVPSTNKKSRIHKDST